MDRFSICTIYFKHVACIIFFIIYANLNASASSTIQITWNDDYKNKEIFIESGFSKIYSTRADTNPTIIDMDPLIIESAISTSATVKVDEDDNAFIDVNIFKCKQHCNWLISFKIPEKATSFEIRRICQSNLRTIDDSYEKYFYCRKIFFRDEAANSQCWKQTLVALSGWFDASYKLHERTLVDGVAFIARDREVESKVIEFLDKCPSFESSTGRKRAYFEGMIRNLDQAVLQRARRVKELLKQNETEAAKKAAQNLVEAIDKAPVLPSAPRKDAIYVEDILKRALPRF